ncbi:D-alanine--D-alanine ligase [Leptospira langatensis]|uniref:D-alanine--D-alanine ligase n=1 Tax=Leptospira langatensis TaxID=2484983 RepID=A0A5F1ZXC2_9LEPT|nr:D-alanine--D-alanine ligase [Leptospira langatensis]TGJ98599.1 D-alanine--D-alanine ligase [Leptospira langatensis]TGL43512.1 D-alanine--D-alanine ligase [Leptospira langatensis]
MKIAVLFGGTSTEHEISLRTGTFISKTLASMGHSVKPILISREGRWVIPKEYRPIFPEGANGNPELYLKQFEELHGVSASNFTSLDCDVVFLGLHGTSGEDGSIQGFLKVLGLPFTGSDVKASALAMDKIRANRLFHLAGMSVAPFWELRKKDFLENPTLVETLDLEYPLFLKPVEGGSSFHTFRINTAEDLERRLPEFFEREDHAILQKFLKGTEVSCGVWEKKEGNKRIARALPPTEIIPGGEFFDVESKYKPGLSQEITPARLPEPIIQKIQEQSILAHKTMGCEAYSRTDFILVDGVPFVLETNTLPGMTETSLIPQQAKAAGIPIEELYQSLIDQALERAGKVPVA